MASPHAWICVIRIIAKPANERIDSAFQLRNDTKPLPIHPFVASRLRSRKFPKYTEVQIGTISHFARS